MAGWRGDFFNFLLKSLYHTGCVCTGCRVQDRSSRYTVKFYIFRVVSYHILISSIILILYVPPMISPIISSMIYMIVYRITVSYIMIYGISYTIIPSHHDILY